jgi:hypothetical protein
VLLLVVERPPALMSALTAGVARSMPQTAQMTLLQASSMQQQLQAAKSHAAHPVGQRRQEERRRVQKMQQQ